MEKDYIDITLSCFQRTSGTSNEEERESLLTTWMLENLASSTVNNEQSLQKPVTRLVAMTVFEF